MFQIAFEANFAAFASPNGDITMWTIETKNIDPLLLAMWKSFEQVRQEEHRRNTTSNLERIARRAARFGINPRALDVSESDKDHWRMEVSERSRIRLRADYFKEQAASLEPLHRQILEGDAKDLHGLLDYIEELEKKFVLSALHPSFPRASWGKSSS